MIAPKTRAKAQTFAEPTPIRSEIGAPGLKQWGGYIDDEWDRRMRNRRDRSDTLAKMQDDATIGAALTAISAIMRQAEYTIEPGIVPDDDAVAFIESCIYEMDDSWEMILDEIATFIVYGFSLFEIVYAVRDGKNGRSNDGKVGWERWSPRSQDTIEQWRFDDKERVDAAIQKMPISSREVTIPLDQCLHFRTKMRRQSPEGKSLIRPAFEPWYYGTQIMRMEGIGIERDTTGMPVMHIPIEDYKDAAKNATWLNIVQTIRRDEHAGLLLPSVFDENGNDLYRFELQSAPGQHQVDTDAVIARYERWKLRVLISDWMALGDQGGGSFALGVSKSAIFIQFVQGLLDIIADVITNQAIRPLCEANSIPDDHAPKMTFGKIEKSDIGRIASAVQVMVAAGIMDANDPALKEWAYGEIGAPMPDGGFEEVDQQAEDDAFDAKLKAAMDKQQAQQQALPPGEKPKEPIGANTFTEQVGHNLYERALNVWRQSVPDELAELLTAQVVTE